MKVMIVGQEPLEVTEDEARAIIQSIVTGVEYIIIGSEYVKATAVMGIRKPNDETLPTTAWGMLPEGRLEHFFDDHREPPGAGYEKFKAMKSKLLEKSNLS